MPLLPFLENWWFFFLLSWKWEVFLHHPTPPPPNLQSSVQINSVFPFCGGWTVNPSPVSLSSSQSLLLQLSLLCPVSILPSLRIMPIRLVVKNPPATAGDERHVGSIPGSGRSLGGGNGNPLQYSCPQNPMDGGAWQTTVHWVTKSQTAEGGAR